MKLSFDAWMVKVNNHLNKLCGLSADDLPDWCYYDAWMDGVASWEAAKDVIEEARTY